MGQRERTFLDNASVLMDSRPGLVNLLYNRKISMTRARDLNQIKSDEAKQDVIDKIKSRELEYDKDIRSYIQNVKLETEKNKKNFLLRRMKKTEDLVKKTKDKNISEDDLSEIIKLFEVIESMLHK